MERRTTSSLKRSALRSAVKGQGPRGKTGARAQGEGKGWGNRQSPGGHTPFTLHSIFLLAAAKRRGCSVLWNHTLSEISRERMGPDAFLWSSQPDHMHLFSGGTLIRPPGQVCTVSEHLSGLEDSSPSYCPLGHGDYSSIFFGKSRLCHDEQCPGLGYNDGAQQVPFFLQRTCEEWSPETLKSEMDPCSTELWMLLKQFSFPVALFSPTHLSRTCLFPFLHGSTCLNSFSPSWL